MAKGKRGGGKDKSDNASKSMNPSGRNPSGAAATSQYLYADKRMYKLNGMKITPPRATYLSKHTITNDPERIWLPLAVLKNTKIRGMTRFQMMVFLAQYESGTHDYKFSDSNYAPYSAELAQSIVSSQRLIDEIERLDDESAEYRYEYSLSNTGHEKLSDLEDVRYESVKNASKTAQKYKLQDHLLESVYSKFEPRLDGSGSHACEILESLRKITVPTSKTFKKSYTRETVLILAWMGNIENILCNIEMTTDAIQRTVIFNISMEMIQRCGRIIDRIDSPANLRRLEPMLREIDEHERLLVEYCDCKGIMKNPYLRPLDEIIAEGDAKRLAKALSKVRIPTS